MFQHLQLVFLNMIHRRFMSVQRLGLMPARIFLISPMVLRKLLLKLRILDRKARLRVQQGKAFAVGQSQ
ncbi:hypothetical protein IY73_03780 [Lawsonella clevelandensis]|uniref:Uncharacterized protein n=1 Tax=Lawsonella clevelandensis TaxID=1528099 RepID=A0A0M4MC36_9ACTN|nr:hypothetical protein AL705_03860 [Lawsonella clevelandensis]ALE34599.1 hypothetical protein IY73_03780 [Lawsonella clevelandensis]